MEQSQALSQNLSQHLAMTMKMQQAIKILALPAQELRGLIEKEYLENPALEIDYDHAALSFEETTGTAGDDAREEREQAYRAEDISALASYLGRPERGDGWDGGESGEPRAFEQAKPVSRTLEEELLEQVEFAYPAGREKEKAVAVFLVGSIDERGYLAVPLSEVARATGTTEAEAAKVLAVIQSFEPAGVGARTLADELLAIDVEGRGPRCSGTLELALGDERMLLPHCSPRRAAGVPPGPTRQRRMARDSAPADLLHGQSRRYSRRAHRHAMPDAEVRRTSPLPESLPAGSSRTIVPAPLSWGQR